MTGSKTLQAAVLGAALALCFTAELTATQPREPGEMESVVVTATRSPEQFADIAGSVSVITREDIRLTVAEDLPELLRLQAGLDVIRTGGAGAQTSVFLRGGNSNHVLVLIDGVRVSSAHTGAYAWEQLPLNQVERIEIVRGPRASLYGSDAIGGVIQVFTRKAPRPHLRLTAGSYGTGELAAGLGFEEPGHFLALGAAYRRTGGFSAQNESGFSFHPDKDGLAAWNLSANGSAGVGGGRLNYLLLASDNETDFDEGVADARQVVAALTFQGTVEPGWDYRVQAGLTDDGLVSDFGFFTSDFQSRRYELSWLNRVSLRQGSIGFGMEFHDESGASASSYDARRDNSGLFLLWDRPLARTDLQLSARMDDNSEFGSEFTWQAALGAEVGATGKLTGLAGTAFRAPSLSEQFSPGFGGLYRGNPRLRPESSETLEVIYRRTLGGSAFASVSAYRTEVADLIAFTGEDFGAINVDRVEIRGLELALGLGSASWNLDASVTLQDAQDRVTGGKLLRRPDRKASLALDHMFANGAWLGADWFVSGGRLDLGNRALPGYGVLSLRGGLILKGDLTLEARLENALDRDYEPALGFNSPGRSLYVSLGWEP
jgi:vitamin B12 transporter